MMIDIHKPIMVNEIMSFIEDSNKLNILDCTFGGGGHSKAFLDRGHSVTALDKDNSAIKKAKVLSKENSNFSYHQINFKDIEKINLKKLNYKFDFILLDLGFSSNQLEDEKIGISFQINSKLNMNYLNTDITAYDIINNYNIEELSRIFFEFGDIQQSKKLAEFIVKIRSFKKIETNFDLIEVLKDSGVNFRSKKIHFATKAFQALRIECNKELENLIALLGKIHSYIRNDGILAIISFHSLEDRIVKKYFKSNEFSQKKGFSNNNNWGYQLLTKKPIAPSKLEVKENNRSRSAKLRVGRLVN